MNIWNRSGCPRVGRWWRTRLRRHTNHPSSSRNILHNKGEMVNQQFSLEHNSNITKITELTGLWAPPGAGAPTAGWPRPEKGKDKISTLMWVWRPEVQTHHDKISSGWLHDQWLPSRVGTPGRTVYHPACTHSSLLSLVLFWIPHKAFRHILMQLECLFHFYTWL